VHGEEESCTEACLLLLSKLVVLASCRGDVCLIPTFGRLRQEDLKLLASLDLQKQQQKIQLSFNKLIMIVFKVDLGMGAMYLLI
jgi:hypothetical protein